MRFEFEAPHREQTSDPPVFSTVHAPQGHIAEPREAWRAEELELGDEAEGELEELHEELHEAELDDKRSRFVGCLSCISSSFTISFSS